MLRRLLIWLDDYLSNEAPSAILRSIIGLLSSVVLLGALLGVVALDAGLLAPVLVALAVLSLLLPVGYYSLRHNEKEHQRVTSRFLGLIHKDEYPVFLFTSWQQITKIDERGNARETIVVQSKAAQDDIRFFRLRFGPGWPQPARYRRKVRVNVRSLSVEDMPGTRMGITSSWLANGRLDLLAHFDSPPRAGDEIRMSLDWQWPGKCAPLMVHKIPDSFTFQLSSTTTHVAQKVILPAGCDAYFEPIGFVDGQDGFSLSRSINDHGQAEFDFEAEPLPADHRAGMRLELKQSRPS